MRKETEIQEIENLISESLNSDKPNKSVVNAAKQLMVEEKLNKNKTEKIITKRRWSLVGVYSCIAVMLIMVCCLIMVNKINLSNIQMIVINFFVGGIVYITVLVLRKNPIVSLLKNIHHKS